MITACLDNFRITTASVSVATFRLWLWYISNIYHIDLLGNKTTTQWNKTQQKYRYILIGSTAYNNILYNLESL